MLITREYPRMLLSVIETPEWIVARTAVRGVRIAAREVLADGEAAALIYRRDIRPALPPPAAGPVLDIGCGQGQLVRLMLADGYDATGIDVSPEQVAAGPGGRPGPGPSRAITGRLLDAAGRGSWPP